MSTEIICDGCKQLNHPSDESHYVPLLTRSLGAMKAGEEAVLCMECYRALTTWEEENEVCLGYVAVTGGLNYEGAESVRGYLESSGAVRICEGDLNRHGWPVTVGVFVLSNTRVDHLERYVLPRLASGLFMGEVITERRAGELGVVL